MFSPVQYDPIKLSYFYNRDMLQSDAFFESKTLESFIDKFHGTDSSLESVKAITQIKYETQDIMDNMALMEYISQEYGALPLKLAEYESFMSYKDTEGEKINSHDESLKLFLNDFLALPLEYLSIRKIKGEFTFLFPGAKSNTALGLSKAYLQKDDKLIINGQAYLAYKMALTLLAPRTFDRYGEYDFVYSPFIDEHISIEELMIYDLYSFIRLRIQVFEQFIESTLKKIRSQYDHSSLFKNDTDLLNYLVKYFQDLHKTDRKISFSVIGRIKFPETINEHFIGCLTAVLEKYLCQLQGTTHQKLLTPLKYEELNELSGKMEDISDKAKEKEVFIDYPYFEKGKIPWPDKKKDDIERWFSKLFNEVNDEEKPFMDEKDVIYLLHSNFSCYSSDEKPKVLQCNGSSGVLRYFIHQVFSRQGITGCGRKRYAQFLIQNFNLFAYTATTKDKFKNLERNIKGVPPKKGRFITID